MKEKFKQFLINNNSYEKFCDELKREREDSFCKNEHYEDFDDCIDSFEEGDEEGYIIGSFSWPKEDVQFWINLQERWQDELSK